MLKTALICEKWNIVLDDQGKSGFFQYMEPNEISRRSAAMEWLLEDLPHAIKVVEYFGGVGVQSVIIQGLLKPKTHHIFELDEDCIRQLKMLYDGNPFITVALGDAKETMGTIEADLVMLDYHNMTAKHLEEWETQLTAVFAKKPRWVELTDIAARYLHLHRPLYSSILGAEVTDIQSYIRGISCYLWRKYGYSISKAAYKATSCYMLLDSDENLEPEFLNVKDLTKSFRYLEGQS